MKKVVKVSIGNMAFTIDEDAYEVLSRYLKDINDHYASQKNGSEIVEGIEERVAELFLERAPEGSVIGMELVREVVALLGHPNDFETVDKDESSYSSAKQPKRIYRNNDNKVLGGVCSGIAAYLGVDVVLIRIIFTLLLTFSFFFSFPFGGVFAVMVVYIIMWVIIPEARTVEQKCAMYGESPDINNIQKRVNDGIDTIGRGINRAGEHGASFFGLLFKAIGKVVAVILIMIGLSGIIALTVALLGIEIVDGFVPVDIIDFINLDGVNILLIKIIGLFVMFLPFVGMLYGGVQLLFGFKPPKYRPGLIIFILWIVSIFALITVSFTSTRGYWHNARDVKELVLNNVPDTLYVKYMKDGEIPENRVIYDAYRSRVDLLWMEGNGDEAKIVSFPQVRVVSMSSGDSAYVKTTVEAFGKTWGEAMIKAERNHPEFEIKDSLLMVHPDRYSKIEKWDGVVKRITVYVPEGKSVIIEEPVKYNFRKNYRYNYRYDWDW